MLVSPCCGVKATHQVNPGHHPLVSSDEKNVLWLDHHGRPVALQDRCCYRSLLLSRAFVEEDCTVCPAQNWVLAQGENYGLNAHRVPVYQCEEHRGYAWVALEKSSQDSYFLDDLNQMVMPYNTAIKIAAPTNQDISA